MPQWIIMGALAGLLAVGAPADVAANDNEPTDRLEQTAGASTALGSVAIPRSVLADGERLSAGTYQLRLTDESAEPDAAGQSPSLNRWVEFVQGDEVRGREVVSIVPSDEIGDVAGAGTPSPGTSIVQMLKNNEYVRIWINQGGTHYLIHLPPA